MSVRTVAAVAAVSCLLAAGCTAVLTSHTYAIGALRSDPDQRGLAATYAGGDCDVSTRLVVKESPTEIDVHVVAATPRGACDAAARLRTVSARLGQPIGIRKVVSDDQQQVPFDGARLLVPAGLTLDTAGIRQSSDSAGSQSGGAHVTDAWTVTYTDPGQSVVGASCTPALGRLQVEVRNALRDDFASNLAKVGTAKVGTAVATLFRPKTPSWNLVYEWPTAHGVVVLSADIRCGHYRSLTRDELLHVARSLRQA